MAADRLFGALLVEMVSGPYQEGNRFLSHRRIMRQWRVAAATATHALHLLSKADVLVVRDRSGHYLPTGFRERALNVLHRTETTGAEPTPLRQHRLGMKVLLDQREGRKVKTIAAVLALRGDGHLRRERCDEVLGRCAASSLTAQGIFLEAESRRIMVHFFLCDESAESEHRTLGRVLNTRPDGVILIKRKSPFREEILGKHLLQRRIPVVVLFGEGGDTDMVSSNFNNVGMGVDAAEAFLQKGHRRLGILTHSESNTNFEDRLRGFHLRSSEEKNTELTEFRLENRPENFPQVVRELRRKRITALFSVTQELMVNLLPALEESGLHIPADVSVLMCSSTAEVQEISRPVNTLILDFPLLGRTALRTLEAYCSGQVAQKAHLVSPLLEDHGTIKKLSSSP